MKNDLKLNLIYAATLILIGVISRLVPHGWNFTAMGAVAVAAGFLISSKRLAFATVLLTLLISDSVIMFHNTMVAVYLGYILMTWASAARPHKNTVNAMLAGATGSVLFFIVSNLGVWFEGQLYPMTQAGLIQCFEMAVPFFKNELIANLILSPVLFLVLSQAKKYFTVLAATEISSKN